MRKTHTLNTLTVRVVARDKASARRLAATIFHGTSPRREQSSCSRRSANGEVILENLIEIGSEESQQEGLIWPLHEGREI